MLIRVHSFRVHPIKQGTKSVRILKQLATSHSHLDAESDEHMLLLSFLPPLTVLHPIQGIVPPTMSKPTDLNQYN